MQNPNRADPRSERHLAYLDVLGAMHAGREAWAPTMAGYVTLCLVDKWTDALRGWLAPRPSEVDAVRDAIAKLPPGPMRNTLTAIVDAVTQSWGRRKAQVSARVLAYGALLYDRSEWALSADVYRTFLGFAAPESDTDLTAYAWYRLGMCEGWLGRPTEAAQAHEAAQRLAQLLGDRYIELAAQHGIALALYRRGNWPEAAARLAQVIADCDKGLMMRPALGAVRTWALQDAGLVAVERGETEQAFRLLGRALDEAPDTRQRERVLNDLALVSIRVGLRPTARQALLVLEATAEDETLRWIASLNLMHVSTLDASPVAFETHRRRLATAKLLPRLAVDYQIYIGEEWRRTGCEREARTAFDRAITIAERHHLNALLIEAEDKRKAGALPPVVTMPDRAQLGEATVRVMDRIAHMSAELVGAGA